MTKYVASIELTEADCTAPFAEPLTEFGTPPDWVLRLLIRNTGRRLKKREITYGYHGSKSYDDQWAGLSYPQGVDDMFSKALSKRERRDERRKQKNLLPVGNLRESDYQFWRGSAASSTTQTQCRWCQEYFYGAAARKDHIKKEKNCLKFIRLTQAFAAKEDATYCMVCGKNSEHRRWGFPLCNTLTCIGAWKFGQIIANNGWLMYKNLAGKAGVFDGLVLEIK